MKFFVANTLSGVGGHVFVAHGNRMADELGKQGYVTGETWKNKPLFASCSSNKADF